MLLSKQVGTRPPGPHVIPGRRNPCGRTAGTTAGAGVGRAERHGGPATRQRRRPEADGASAGPEWTRTGAFRPLASLAHRSAREPCRRGAAGPSAGVTTGRHSRIGAQASVEASAQQRTDGPSAPLADAAAGRSAGRPHPTAPALIAGLPAPAARRVGATRPLPASPFRTLHHNARTRRCVVRPTPAAGPICRPRPPARPARAGPPSNVGWAGRGGRSDVAVGVILVGLGLGGVVVVGVVLAHVRHVLVGQRRPAARRGGAGGRGRGRGVGAACW